MFKIEVLENLSECILIVNEQNNIEYVNKALENVFGYEPHELLNKPLGVLLPKEVSKKHSSYTKDYFKRPTTRQMGAGRELNGLHKNGSIIPIDVSLSHFKADGRKLAVAIVVDISERIKLYEELSLSQSLYSSLVENTIDHIFQIDTDLKVLYINHVSPGLTKDKVIGSSLLELLPSTEVREYVKEIIENVLKTGTPNSYELKFPSPVGTLIYATTVTPVIKNGNIVGANLISRDFTESINLKHELIIKQNFIDKLDTYSQNGIYIYNIKKRLNTYVNGAYKQILGYTIKEINEMTPEEFFNCFHPDDQEAIAKHMNKVASLPQGKSIEIVYRFKSKASKWVWCKSKDSGFEYDKSGNLVSFIGSFIDITQQKEMEASLKLKSDEMERFAHVVSHDLRSPLNNIISSLEYLNNPEISNADDAKVLMKLLLDSTKRSREMINALLLNASIDQEHEMSNFSVENTIKNLEQDLSELIKNKKVSLTYQDLPSIYGSNTMIRMLFQNLITNSIKYKKENLDPVIEISCDEKLSHWIFYFKDNGSGIKKSEQNGIFNMFSRGSTHINIEGLGIGLANCKKIIDMHNGNIWLESELNQGTTFIFSIPKMSESL